MNRNNILDSLMQHSDFDHTVNTSRETTASVTAIWGVLSQLNHLAAWAPGIESSSIVTEATEGVGVVRRVQNTQFGEIDQEMKTWEPDQSLSYVTKGSGPFAATYTSYDIEASEGEHTKVTAELSFDLHPGTMPPDKAKTAVRDGLSSILKALDAQARVTTD